MSSTVLIIIGIITVLLLAIGTVIHFYKKKNVEQLFRQVYESSKQIPKKKKNAFLLLMFVETMAASKKKQNVNLGKLNNPKYLELQLLQMNKILKDPKNVKDRNTKYALTLLKEYLVWEEKKKQEANKTKEEQAS